MESFFGKHTDPRLPAAPQGGEPFKSCNKLKRAALQYAKVANKAPFLKEGPSAQPRGAQLELVFFNRPQEGVENAAEQGIIAQIPVRCLNCVHNSLLRLPRCSLS
jgi:hypothetical protein